jgi:hypothetical protein
MRVGIGSMGVPRRPLYEDTLLADLRNTGLVLMSSALHGVVRGYGVDDVTTARSALQPLLIFSFVRLEERDGVLLVFRTRAAAGCQRGQRDVGLWREGTEGLVGSRRGKRRSQAACASATLRADGLQGAHSGRYSTRAGKPRPDPIVAGADQRRGPTHRRAVAEQSCRVTLRGCVPIIAVQVTGDGNPPVWRQAVSH